MRTTCYIPGRIRYTFCLKGTCSLGIVIWIKVFSERYWDCEADSVDLGDQCENHEKLMNSHKEKRSQRKPRKSSSVQFSSVAQSCLTLCDPMNCSTPGLPVHHQLLEFTQTHVHRVGDTIQPSHPLSSPFPPAPNPSHYQGLFQWVSCLHQVAKVLELQLQHQSFQWTSGIDLL